jgi:hypothetical protein
VKRTLITAMLVLGGVACGGPSKEAGPAGTGPARPMTIARQPVEALAAGALPARDGRYLDASRSAASPAYAKLLTAIERERPADAGAAVRTFVQVHRDGGVTYAYRPCGVPLMKLWIADRQLWISYWEPQAYELDRAQLGADGFEVAISAASIGESRHPDWVPATPRVAGSVVARDPAVYQIDVWGRSSLLAVQVEDLARLPLVINSCLTQKMEELPWTD